MNRRDILIAYMKSCIEIEDWHGVSDAANDLRELDAEDRIKRRVHEIDSATGRAIRGDFYLSKPNLL